jgi:hypothetical protein
MGQCPVRCTESYTSSEISLIERFRPKNPLSFIEKNELLKLIEQNAEALRR